MKLSIVVITMNRAEQLCSALLSCINSALPTDTDFVIVDNASTDNTESAVREFFVEHPYPYIYEKETVNKGVGGGRNRGFELADGEFVYFLDDDAVVSPESYGSFFVKPVELFQKDALIASITTRIYDELLEDDREVVFAKKHNEESVPEIYMYLGGSHFLRKKYYDIPLYLDFKYGMEEVLPSIYAIDKGFKNCYLHDLKALHQPKRNKWVEGSEEGKSIIADYNVNIYVSKKMIYPTVFLPLLYLAFICRTFRCFGLNAHMWSVSKDKIRSQKDNLKSKPRKIKGKTVYAIIKKYSFGTAF